MTPEARRTELERKVTDLIRNGGSVMDAVDLALEQAAKVAESQSCFAIAAAIRALIPGTTPPAT